VVRGLSGQNGIFWKVTKDLLEAARMNELVIARMEYSRKILGISI
jgi:hypothetical protein